MELDEKAYERTTGLAVVVMCLVDLLVDKQVLSPEELSAKIRGFTSIMEKNDPDGYDLKIMNAILEKHLTPEAPSE